MKQIEINNLLWDTENLEFDGRRKFTWQEAIYAAKSVGKRLPTKDEFDALIQTGWEWDKENKGTWFADRKIFFPIFGSFIYTTSPLSIIEDGNLWSSTPMDNSYSWFLFFTNISTCMYGSKITNSLPVRCVQDKQVEINGLLWDTENFEIDGCNKFSYPEAKEYARMKGKRLPTKEEYAALISTGYCINIDKGYEFDSKKLFFPFDGSILYSNREYDIKEDGSKTCLWTQSSCYDKAFLLELNNSTYDEPMLYEDNPLNRLSVRFVQDISRTDYDSLYKISELPTLLDHLTLKEAVELYEKLHERKIEEVKVKMKGLKDYIPREENMQ